MKTELEWVNIDSGNLPERNRELLLVIESENIVGGMEDYLMIGEMQKNLNGENHFDIAHGRPISFFGPNFENDGKKIIKWAYVNLPEEKHKYTCKACGKKTSEVIISDSLPIPSEICIECKAKEKIVCHICLWSNINLVNDAQEEGKVICFPCSYKREKEKEVFELKKCEGCSGRIDGGSLVYCNKCKEREKEMASFYQRPDGIKDLLENMKEKVTLSRSHEVSGKKHFTCCKCSQDSEMELICNNCSNDGWIWPLKQLPEKDQKVEVMFFIENKVDKEAWFDGEIFRGNNFVGYSNVIAWRPLREAKLEERKPEQLPKGYIFGDTSDVKKYIADENGKFVETERKPDFSKLREGDLVVVNLEEMEISGFVIDCDYDTVTISPTKKSNIKSNHSSYNIESIKKIIRINIDSPTSIVNLGDDMKIGLPFGAYPFEEI